MEEGEEASWLDYVMHFVSMPWKILCAIIPPKTLLGAYPTFICSILWIAGMSAVIEQVSYFKAVPTQRVVNTGRWICQIYHHLVKVYTVLISARYCYG